MLQQQTCIIRHAEEQDAQDLARIHAQRSSHFWTLQLPYPTVKLWKERIAALDQTHFVLVAEVNSQVVGVIGFECGRNPRTRHVATIGMTVDEKSRGKGIGQKLLEAAIDVGEKWLGITRFALEVYTDNAAAIKLYEKMGFVKEGTLRGNALRDGIFVDSFIMARVKA